MIKGHSGSGTRSSADANAGPILMLSTDPCNPSDSGMPNGVGNGIGMGRTANSSSPTPSSPNSPHSASTGPVLVSLQQHVERLTLSNAAVDVRMVPRLCARNDTALNVNVNTSIARLSPLPV
jgi:hypothetical protein